MQITRLLLRVIKSSKIIGLLQKIIKLYNKTVNKDFNIKLLQLCIKKILYNFKFLNIALFIIEYKKK